jgi:hypothetical protein
MLFLSKYSYNIFRILKIKNKKLNEIIIYIYIYMQINPCGWPKL